jgi:hypothetical protein
MKSNKIIHFTQAAYSSLGAGLIALVSGFNPLAFILVSILASIVLPAQGAGSLFSIFYAPGCDGDILTHECDPCPTKELGRVRGVAYVHQDVAFSDETDEAEWNTYIEAGLVVIIPETNGSFDGGTPTFSTGFGDVPESYDSSEFKINYKDPNFLGNCVFYNSLRRSRNWRVCWRTETRAYLSTVACTAYGKSPVADDIKSSVVWEVEVKFTQADTPCPFVIPDGIFQCFDVIPTP